MNNLEKKQERLKHLKELQKRTKEKAERIAGEIKDLEKAIEAESMADVFREGKVNRMTVNDWKKVRDSIATGELQEFLKQKYGEETETNRQGLKESRDDEKV